MNQAETPDRWKRGDRFSASHLNQAVDLVSAASPITSGDGEHHSGRHGTTLFSGQKVRGATVIRFVAGDQIHRGIWYGKSITGPACPDLSGDLAFLEPGEDESADPDVVVLSRTPLVSGQRYTALRVGTVADADQLPVYEATASGGTRLFANLVQSGGSNGTANFSRCTYTYNVYERLADGSSGDLLASGVPKYTEREWLAPVNAATRGIVEVDPGGNWVITDLNETYGTGCS